MIGLTSLLQQAMILTLISILALVFFARLNEEAILCLKEKFYE